MPPSSAPSSSLLTLAADVDAMVPIGGGPKPHAAVLRGPKPGDPTVIITRDPRAGPMTVEVLFLTWESHARGAEFAEELRRICSRRTRVIHTVDGASGRQVAVVTRMHHQVTEAGFLLAEMQLARRAEDHLGAAWLLERACVTIADEGRIIESPGMRTQSAESPPIRPGVRVSGGSDFDADSFEPVGDPGPPRTTTPTPHAMEPADDSRTHAGEEPEGGGGRRGRIDPEVLAEMGRMRDQFRTSLQRPPERPGDWNEQMRRPLNPAFAMARLLFAAATVALCLGRIPPWLLWAWGAVWCLEFGRDALFGLTPAQGLGGCILGLVGWLLWLAVVGAAVMGTWLS